MRLLSLLVVVLVGSASAAPRGTLRLVIVPGGELLGSETRALTELRKKITKSWSGTVQAEDATPVENMAAQQLFVGPPPLSELPPGWQSAELVVALQILPPVGDKGKRLSQGFGAFAILRPPSKQPIFLQRLEGKAELPLQSAGFATWLPSVISATTSDHTR